MREALAQARVDALLVTRSEDVSYLSDFSGDDSFLLIGGGGGGGGGRKPSRRRRPWACLITDGRYAELARKQCRGVEVIVRSGSMSSAVAETLKGRAVRALGVQADHVTLRQRSLLDKAMPAKRIVPVTDVTLAVRAVKDAGEVRLIRKAIRAAETAFCSLIATGAKALIGRTERQVAAELDYRMRGAGADKSAFDAISSSSGTIVAAGPHCSLPHYRPGDTVIRRGQGVLFDWGAMVDGYCCDLTRVVFTGRIPPKLAEVYNVVLKAQAAGIRAVRPGASGRSVDAAARSVIEQAGYGERFVHGLGHGIGRAVHEAPYLGRSVKARLRRGMIVTIEPGIYLPGLGGVRLEDDVLVTPGGRRRLSSLPTAIEAMVLR